MTNISDPAGRTSTGNPCFSLKDSHQLMIAFMDEQYAAARHHQTLRTQTLAFLTAAVSALLGVAARSASEYHPVCGWAIIAIAIFSSIANFVFYRNNRIHSETATACRKILAKYAAEDLQTDKLHGAPTDPIWVRKAVENAARFPFYNADFKEILQYHVQSSKEGGFKVEYILSTVFHLVPVLMLAAGIAVLARLTI